MDGSTVERSILDWDESDVHAWFSNLGYPQYESAIRENNISGDVLCLLDSEGLKAIGVSTVGQRLAILKAVYQAKIAYNVPIESDDYIPPSEAEDRLGDISLEKLSDIVREQTQRLQYLEDENQRLSEYLSLFLEEFYSSQTPQATATDTSLRRQGSFKWAQYKPPSRSPTKPDSMESPNPSPQRLEHDMTPLARTVPLSISQPSPVDKSRLQNHSGHDSPSSSHLRPHRTEAAGFRVTLDDPTWKVLPAALRKYKIQNDTWQNYAMFICYDGHDGRIERCLSYDEKPLILFQRLRDTEKKPVFMLKHIKEIRSPIVVAQQKHAARKASSSSSLHSQTQTHAHLQSGKPVGGATGTRPAPRPPRLEVNDLTATPVLSNVSPQPAWLEVLSPGLDAELSVSTPAVSIAGSSFGSDSIGKSSRGLHTTDGESRNMSLTTTKVSWAVAIYPYMAEQDDEFDVVVGDAFVILSRARGWWVVQRDPTGSGVVDPDMSKQGWVPAGCLLETNVPVASAIAEANMAKASGLGSPPASPLHKTPILPLSIISTSFPGIALLDYQKKGEEELDLCKDDALRVFKRYNHWSYAVKEAGGDRGWVPSWFIGKISTSNHTPVTPSTTSAPALSNSVVEVDNGQTQVSPMSSAFPPGQRIGATA